MASKRKRAILRALTSRATEKYSVGGRLKAQRAPITLAKIRPRGRRVYSGAD